MSKKNINFKNRNKTLDATEYELSSKKNENRLDAAILKMYTLNQITKFF